MSLEQKLVGDCDGWIQNEIFALCQTAISVNDAVAIVKYRDQLELSENEDLRQINTLFTKLVTSFQRNGASIQRWAYVAYQGNHEPDEATRWYMKDRPCNRVMFSNDNFGSAVPDFSTTWRFPTRLSAQVKSRFKAGKYCAAQCILKNKRKSHEQSFYEPFALYAVTRIPTLKELCTVTVKPHGPDTMCGSCTGEHSDLELDLLEPAMTVAGTQDSNEICSVRRYVRCARLRMNPHIKWIYAPKFDEDNSPSHSFKDWEAVTTANDIVCNMDNTKQRPRVLPCYKNTAMVADVIRLRTLRFRTGRRPLN